VYLKKGHRRRHRQALNLGQKRVGVWNWIKGRECRRHWRKGPGRHRGLQGVGPSEKVTGGLSDNDRELSLSGHVK
jgi:hypothetical protein